jgi:hypothetical protein
MRGSGLAARLNALGVPWNRTTIAKFETGQRAAVSVQEWLALAIALDVPPLWLVADVETGAATPIAKDVTSDPWSTVLWMGGRQPLDECDRGLWWDRVAPSIGRIYGIASAIEQLRRNQAERVASVGELSGFPDVEATSAERDRQLLRLIVSMVEEIGRSGLVLPTLPEDVQVRADDLGVKLPGA